MSADGNRILFEQFWNEVWNEGNPDRAPEFVAIDTLPYILQFYGVFTKFADDLRVELEDVVVEGNKVGAAVIFSGTHTGPLIMPGMNVPPTGKRARVRMVGIWQYRNGKIERFWGEWDQPGLLRQLGVMPGPPPADVSG